MKNKKTLSLTIIAVATLLVAVVGATFAYFVATGSVANTSNAVVTTSAVDTVSGGSTSCTLNVTGDMMRLADGTASGVPHTVTDPCTISIIGTKDANNSTATTCTYDVTLTPTSAWTYASTGHSATKPELTLQGTAALDVAANGSLTTTSYAETDMYNITTKQTIVSGATFTFSDDATATWSFYPTVYNYNFDQTTPIVNGNPSTTIGISDRTFAATLAIENLSCTAAASQQTPTTWTAYRANANSSINGVNYQNGGTIENESYDGIGDATTDVNEIRSVTPVYFKHTIDSNGIIQNTDFCLYYNSGELCLDGDYLGTDVTSTLNKLRIDIINNLDYSSPTCETQDLTHLYANVESGYRVVCNFDSKQILIENSTGTSGSFVEYTISDTSSGYYCSMGQNNDDGYSSSCIVPDNSGGR